jgi:hypothetical protein
METAALQEKKFKGTYISLNALSSKKKKFKLIVTRINQIRENISIPYDWPHSNDWQRTK